MKKWYQERYINRRDWILENSEKIKLDNNEILLVIFLDYLNSHNIKITTDILTKKMKCNEQELDILIQQLCLKNILELKTENELIYDISKLFEKELNQEFDIHLQDVYAIFEKEFGRFLSKIEIEKISDLNHKYNKNKLIKALQKASAYKKLSMNYIETILSNDE